METLRVVFIVRVIADVLTVATLLIAIGAVLQFVTTPSGDGWEATMLCSVLFGAAAQFHRHCLLPAAESIAKDETSA